MLRRNRIKAYKCPAGIWTIGYGHTATAKPEMRISYDKAEELLRQDLERFEEFRCFCPKVFSTISPLHLDDRFKELKRRLIVIPCKRVEELPEARLAEIGISQDNWQQRLLNIDAYDWKGFSDEFQSYWDLEKAQKFIQARRDLGKSKIALSSNQRAVSLDLLATGIATGIWANQEMAVERMKSYWRWFKSETDQSAGLGQLLKDYLNTEVESYRASGRQAQIDSSRIRYQIKAWVEMGWLFEQPKGTVVRDLMYDLGWRFQQGKWSKD